MRKDQGPLPPKTTFPPGPIVDWFHTGTGFEGSSGEMSGDGGQHSTQGREPAIEFKTLLESRRECNPIRAQFLRACSRVSIVNVWQDFSQSPAGQSHAPQKTVTDSQQHEVKQMLPWTRDASRPTNVGKL